MLLQLVVIQIATFAALIFILRFLFYRQLNSSLGRLKSIHEENLAREEELTGELDKLKKERDAELAKTREEAERILKVAKEKSVKIEEQYLAQAKEDAAKIVEGARAESAKIKVGLESSYRQKSLDLSVEIISRIFTDKDSKALQRQLIDEMIEEIRIMPASLFTVQSKTVKARSAYPLHEKEQQELVLILSDKTNIPVELVFEDSSDIIAGLVIEIGALTLDGSLKNKISKVLADIQKNS